MLTGSPFLSLIIVILVIGLIVTVVVYLIDSSPIVEPFKAWARWGVIAIGVIYILIRLAAALGVAI